MDREYEKVSEFCTFCTCIGYSIGSCKRKDEKLKKKIDQTNLKPKTWTQSVYMHGGKKILNEDLDKILNEDLGKVS